mgnify:CR=1 FL=1
MPEFNGEREMRELIEEFLDKLFADLTDNDEWDTYASPEAVIADTENYLSEFTVELAKYLHTPEFKTFVTEQWERHKQN